MISLLWILLLPLFMPGLISRVKAIMVGRKGQSLLQPYYHFLKLLRKDEVISSSASFITRLAPSIALSATLCAALFVPVGRSSSLLSFQGDFILVLYLLALAKGIMVLAAMDSGSSFEGMGASREISFTAFLEPAFMLIMAGLIFTSGFTSLNSLLDSYIINNHEVWSLVVGAFTIFALFIMLLVESARVPFDDPNTHLELTMIHEVMILDYSGFSLGLIHYTAALKMLIYASLIAQIMIPQNAQWHMGWYLLCVLGLGLVTGIVESMMARFRMNRNLELVLVPLSISVLAIAALIARSLGGW
ncbi:MAG: NADH-quinone oxidoreductase subunit H [Candidatus Cloacimonetes bacterium]|nr:NADH-quinone oxidoreductase subunit H [Candidatus Cloacimonadota bacterium]MCK9335491.1 NADH-quinone oxidoreductase subunit H [Candidatus Cloacimonadota bacterium]MDD2683484.1 NADH-quinone oxidoreductase subunit H [Candidatus Cloacimonadota bacterium]MDD4034486.1 NADH-quinone oxidoreductase subunit H [Candidatus Cloacimonadota bacterium]MDD4666597.1 NADH-quinone oxidoreductase subunit H [Candidatus Cloacimonadota bacterium]